MKAFFPKRSVHPSNSVGTGTEESNKGEVSLIIPITSELNYFERRLNTQGNLTQFEPLSELNEFYVRKYRRSSEITEDAFNEPCKYEVLSTSGHLVYFIAEQTEYFVHGTTCLSKPETMEFNVMTPGGESVMKYFIEYGRTGYSKTITAVQNCRKIGSVTRPCRILSPNQFSIRDSSDKTIMNIKPKDCCICVFCRSRFNLFSPRSSMSINQFDIYSSFQRRGNRICKGAIGRDWDSEIESFSLSLFHGVDTLGKSLLISALILIDLELSPRRRNRRLISCHILSCLPQFVASIFFYVIFLILVATLVFLILIPESS